VHAVSYFQLWPMACGMISMLAAVRRPQILLCFSVSSGHLLLPLLFSIIAFGPHDADVVAPFN
jgi:hypothetical protein